MSNRIEIVTARARDLLITALVAGAFVTLSIFVIGFMAARPVPGWYVPILHGHPYWGLILWSFVTASLPNGLLAFLCAVVLARFTRSSARLVAAVALAMWVLVPFAMDLFSGPETLAEQVRGYASAWLPIGLTWALVFVALSITLRAMRPAERA